MKHIIFVVVLSISCFSCSSQSEQRIKNLKTFAKSYGYVKYFHPTDEAASLDWENFAIYGAAQIEKCDSEKEVVSTLENLFGPISPSANFELAKTPSRFNLLTITPRDTKNYELSFWQHKGVSRGMVNKGRPYLSARVNRKSRTDNSDAFGNIMTSIDGSKYQGKEIKYTGWVKLNEGSKGTGHLWFRVDNSDGSKGFFDNMRNTPIVESQWKQYEIVGRVDSLATSLVFGCFLIGKGKLFLDDIQLSYKEGNDWIEIPVKNSDFESGDLSTEKEGAEWRAVGNGYRFKSYEESKYEGEKSAVIDFVGDTKEEKGKQIFDLKPEFGELIEKKIGDNIFCQIPIVLYANDQSTYPKPKEEELNFLKKEIERSSSEPTELAFRLGNVINTFNVFQHFYPYFDVVDVDWENELEKALLRCYTDKTEKDHIITLQKFTAALKDGHISVSGGNMGAFAPPILWEWVEGKLIITHVFDEKTALDVGDEVSHINKQSATNFFKEINSRISAGTEGWLAYKAKNASLLGVKDSKISITVNGKKVELARGKDFYNEIRPLIPKRDSYKKIDDEVFYLNLDSAPIDAINKLLPQLVKSKSIICDMRGYPNGNHEFISHLLKSNDTTEAWMQVPKIIYPDQEDIGGYEKYDWKMKAQKPYLGDKQIIFITDGRAISYAESFMGYIEGYKLATIIGQPTAGTNGNVNSFNLPGGYRINWTGMKVVKHDGSQHHGVGILPNIYVSKTVEGVKSGVDELLERAIELTREK